MTVFAVGASTHAGKVRPTNQDNLLANDPMFVVADGMGGHRGGETASAIVADALAAAATVATVDDLIEEVQKANSQIVDRGELERELRGMGTTVTVLTDLHGPGPDRLGVANVGDSRLYRVTDGVLCQHTTDHSLVESLVRDGRLTRAEAAVHPQRNIITRALGIDERVLVDAWELVPVKGDRYLLCSDGLFNEVDEDEICGVLTSFGSAQEAADELVDRAVGAGGRDNISVVVVDIVDAEIGDAPPSDRVTATHLALDHSAPIVEPPSIDTHDSDVSELRSGGFGAESISAKTTGRLVLLVVAVFVVLAVLLAALAA
ncbi:MAG: protein phosphatase 2C domain-containing protein [Acidimicrobiales bacterium]